MSDLSLTTAQQINEVLLISYLAAITKGTATASEVSLPLLVIPVKQIPNSFLSQFVTKVNAIFDRMGIGRRARGLVF